MTRPRDLTGRQVRRLDHLAQHRYGIPTLVLMEHAGTAVARLVRRLTRGRVVVLCGRGHNGGDGLVAARHLDRWGVPVTVVMVGAPPAGEGPAAVNWRIVRRLGLPIVWCASAASTRRLGPQLRRAALLVDALLGTGASGPVREPTASAIAMVNAARRPVVAVDLPSGVDADTGAVLTLAVRAQRTVTFGAMKRGLRHGQGPAHAGRIEIADISWPRQLLR